MFEEYVQYYAVRPESQAVWTQSLFFAPSDINRRLFDQLKIYQAQVEMWNQQAITEGMKGRVKSETEKAF